MSRAALVVCLTAVVTAAAASAYAQDRRGISLSLSGGYGSADTRCAGCGDDGRQAAVAGGLTLGWGLSDRLIVGAAIDFWTDEHDDRRNDVTATDNLYTLTGTITMYPSRTAGLFVRVGIGAAMVDREVRRAGRRDIFDLGTGVGAVAAVGDDIRVGRRWILTPAVNLAWGRPGDLRVGDEVLEREVRFTIVALTVGLTFQ